MNPASQVCTGCGLCCTGALFDRARLEPAEVPLAAELGMTLWAQEPPQFAFPCPQLDGAACRSYARRPAICAKYRCEVLNNLDRGTLDMAAAEAITARAVALVRQIEALLPQGQTIGDARRAWSNDAQAWRAGPEAAQLHLLVTTLNLLLDRHFRREHQKLAHFMQGDS